MAEMKETIREALEQVKKIADTKTVIGDPIQIVDGVTILPVSKVTVGTAIGGGEYDNRKSTAKSANTTVVNGSFTGGSGAGITVSPVAFLVINKDGETKLLNIGENSGYLEATILGAVNGFDTALDKMPGIWEKLAGLFGKKDKRAVVSEEAKDGEKEQA